MVVVDAFPELRFLASPLLRCIEEVEFRVFAQSAKNNLLRRAIRASSRCGPE